MDVETISYLYSLPELYALIRLVGYAGIPCFPQKASLFEEGMDQLTASLLVSQAEQTVAVDKISAYLAKAVGSAEQFLCVTGDSYLGLFYSPAMTVFLELRKTRWHLTPYPEAPQALDAMMHALLRGALPEAVYIRCAGGQWRRSCAEADNLSELVRTAAQWVFNNQIPTGKDAVTWKP